jgi:hypothetical protein
VCTVTIQRQGADLFVTMNRDERRGRAPELPPARSGGEAGLPVRAGPRDGESGGTWIGVNHRGAVACLLNLYDDSSWEQELLLPSGRRSRGEIVPALLAASPRTDADDWPAQALPLHEYAPFTLLLADSAGARRWDWDGGRLSSARLSGEWLLVSSSAWRRDEVLAWRRELLADWLERGAPFQGLIPSYHLEQPPGREEWAPLMARPLSATRSITRIAVEPRLGRCTLLYWRVPVADPRAPDARLELPLAGGQLTA